MRSEFVQQVVVGLLALMVHLNDAANNRGIGKLVRLVKCTGTIMEARRFTHSRNITKAVFLSRQDLAEDAPHDLATPGLGKIVDDVHGFGRSEGANRFPDLQDQFLPDPVNVLLCF